MIYINLMCIELWMVLNSSDSWSAVIKVGVNSKKNDMFLPSAIQKFRISARLALSSSTLNEFTELAQMHEEIQYHQNTKWCINDIF